jgi:hypothetical protein
MSKIERCKECGANLAMVGIRHRCIPGAAQALADAKRREVLEVKRGRPRLGESRSKPWLDCVPPMSKTTWYRRQKESKK